MRTTGIPSRLAPARSARSARRARRLGQAPRRPAARARAGGHALRPRPAASTGAEPPRPGRRRSACSDVDAGSTARAGTPRQVRLALDLVQRADAQDAQRVGRARRRSAWGEQRVSTLRARRGPSRRVARRTRRRSACGCRARWSPRTPPRRPFAEHPPLHVQVRAVGGEAVGSPVSRPMIKPAVAGWLAKWQCTWITPSACIGERRGRPSGSMPSADEEVRGFRPVPRHDVRRLAGTRRGRRRSQYELARQDRGDGRARTATRDESRASGCTSPARSRSSG